MIKKTKITSDIAFYRSYYLSTLSEINDELEKFNNNEQPDENSYFPSVPSPLYIIDIINKCNESGFNFLDIGCGFGNLLKVAEKMGMNADGIELNESLSKYHKDLNVFYIDALKQEFDYNKYDVIYLFRPIFDNAKAEELFANIIKTAKIGCVIIYLEPHWDFDEYYEDESVSSLFNFNKKVQGYNKKLICEASARIKDKGSYSACGIFRVFSKIG